MNDEHRRKEARTKMNENEQGMLCRGNCSQFVLSGYIQVTGAVRAPNWVLRSVNGDKDHNSQPWHGASISSYMTTLLTAVVKTVLQSRRYLPSGYGYSNGNIAVVM
jgi:hypothetical protein